MRALSIGYFLFVFLCFHAKSQNNFDTNYTVKDGLPSNTVYAVEQDDFGFIWFGTDSGLSRFDGYEFINYSIEDGLPDTEILNFFQDSQSRIWFYTLNGKVGFVQNGSIYSSTNTSWLKELDFDGRISSIVEHDGKIFLSDINASIKILEGQRAYDLPAKINNLLSSTYSLCTCENELFFAGVFNSHIIKDDDEIDEISYGFKLPGSLIYPKCEEGIVYAFTIGENRLVRISKDRSYFSEKYPSDIFNLKLLNGKLILFLTSGVYEVDKQNLNNNIRIKNISTATSMLIDQEQNEWYTSLEKGVFINLKKEVKRVGDISKVSTLHSFNSTLYIAHDYRKISKYNRGNIDRYLTLEKESKILDLLVESDTAIWTNRRDGIYLNERLITSIIGRSLAMQNEFVYQGVARGLQLFQQGEVKGRIFYPINNNIAPSHNMVLDIVTLSDDSLLLGTDKGLWSYSKSGFKDASKSPLLSVRMNKISFDSEGTLWIATAREGVISMSKDGVLNQYTSRDGLTSNICTDLEINDTEVWISTPNGLNKLERSRTNDQYEVLNILDELAPWNINDIESFQDSIYIATNDGLFSLSHEVALSEKNTFEVFIDKVLANGQPTLQNAFNHSISSIEITFKGLVFRNNKNLIYQYQLVNQGASPNEAGWVATSTNTINFSNPSPGGYSIWIRAKTKNGDWTNPINYDFKVIPAFWQRIAVQIGAIVFLLLLGFLTVRNYYRIQASKKGLERDKISSEIKALKAQINPHFLFNSLNSIQSFLLDGDIDHADEYLIKYSKLIRMVLDLSDKLMVTLAEELELLSLYVSLEKLRFENGFEFNVKVADDISADSIKIPSMVIQPLIENAIWHGISPLQKPGIINLTTIKNQDFHEIIIEDNGVGFETHHPFKKGKHVSKGSKLVSDRLQLIDQIEGTDSKLSINSKLNIGTTVTLAFPID